MIGCNNKIGETTEGSTGDSTGICDFDNAGHGIYHVKCVNDTDNFWEKKFDGSPYHGPYINACVEVHPANDDPTEGWRVTLKDGCSDMCAFLANQNGYANDTSNYETQCDRWNWSHVEATPGYVGTDPNMCWWYTCPNPTPLLDFDLIESILGSQAAVDAEDLPCDLAFDCHEYLSAAAATALWTEPKSGVENTANTAVEAVTGSQLYVIGAGQGTGTTKPLTGEAAFTATSCGADACPFYLAQYELEGPSSSFNVTLNVGLVGLTKTISGLSIKLAQPALGMWLPDSGYVIFPSTSLQFRMSATISGTPEPFGENGSYDDVYTVNGYVFGHWDPITGEFTMGANGEDDLGEYTVSGIFEM